MWTVWGSVCVCSLLFGVAAPCALKGPDAGYFKMNEKKPTGTVVGTIELQNGLVSSLTEAVPGSPYFDFDPDTLSVLVQSPYDLDTERVGTIDMVLTCVDQSGQSIEIPLTMDVAGINDHAPAFEKDNYTFNVSENSLSSLTVGRVRAIDADFGNRRIEYTIQDGPFSSYFEIETVYQTATIKLMHALDYESFQTAYIILEAKDCPPSSDGSTCGSARQKTSAHVNINVMDYDDLDPVFDRLSYAATIREDIKQGAEIIIVRARDQDSLGAAIEYSAYPGQAASHAFSVERHTGVVRVEDAEAIVRGHVFLYTVKAYQSDAEHRPVSTTIYITVDPSHTNAPVFDLAPYSVEVSESTPTGSAILTLSATDPDVMIPGWGISHRLNKDHELSFWVVSGEHFKIIKTGPSVANLLVAKPLDYETSKTHGVRVAVSDGTNVTTTTVQVTVLNANDASPQFTQSAYEVSSVDVSACYNMLKVTAVDRDEKDSTIAYGLMGYTELFTIDSNGSISCTPALKQLTCCSELRFVVVATDGPYNTRRGMAVVKVTLAGRQGANPSVSAATGQTEDDRTLAYALGAVAAILLLVCILLVLLYSRRRVKNAFSSLHREKARAAEKERRLNGSQPDLCKPRGHHMGNIPNIPPSPDLSSFRLHTDIESASENTPTPPARCSPGILDGRSLGGSVAAYSHINNLDPDTCVTPLNDVDDPSNRPKVTIYI